MPDERCEVVLGGRDVAERLEMPVTDAVNRPKVRRGQRSFPKAVAKITDDLAEMLAVYELPGRALGAPAHDEPPSSRRIDRAAPTTVTRGLESQAAGLAMVFKLIIAAQDRWRAVDAPQLVALVRAGARFVSGRLVEREDDRQAVEPPVESAA